MLGGTSLRRSAAAAALARQRATLPVRSQRSLSSFATGATQLPLRSSSISSLNSFRRPVIRSLPRLASARFNSTAAATAGVGASNADTTATSITPGGTAGTPPAPFSDIPDLDISQIPEKVGYLKELGLDYGWGPSSVIQFVLENIHIYTGIPWWASVVATAVVLRVALFHPTLQASDTTAKLHDVKPLLDPVRQRMVELIRQNDQVGATKEKQKMSMISKQHGVQSWKAFMPMLQIPLGFGCFRVMRGMSALPVPALENEQLLWLTDLTIRDPTFLLPMATGAMMYYTLKRGGEAGTSPIVNTPIGKTMIYALPVISFAATSFWPSLLQLYFFASAALGAAQNLLITSTRFRQLVGITPLPTTKPKGSGGPQDNSAQGRLRMIAYEAAAEKAAAERQISFIDRAVNNIKSSTQEFRKEAQSQMDKFAGTDGAKKAPKRSKKEIEEANDYELRRTEEAQWQRRERNSKRVAQFKKKS